MIVVRKSNERGHANHGWLDSFHTFSFADYYDRAFMGFRTLRVINEDRVAGGMGFSTHPHREMEILTYVMTGALAHRDSMGSEEVINAGDFQLMSAGTGVTHSEYNASATEEVHLYQIWIQPSQGKTKPSYDQRTVPLAQKKNTLCCVVSPDSQDGSMKILQDARVFVCNLDANKEIEFSLASARYAWIQVCAGELQLNDVVIAAGDGAAVHDVSALKFNTKDGAEFLLFDLN